MSIKEKIANLKKTKGFLALVIVVLLLIPTIYSFVFLSAYWDPYGRLENVPVALVNEDKGKDGENKGKDLAQALEDENALDIREMNAEDAAYDLSVGRVYATVTIPSDFTANLLSAETANKTQAEIVYAPNQKSNYVVSQILKMAMAEVRQRVNSEASEQIVSSLSDKLREVPDKVQQIDDGLVLLSNGAQQLKTGITTLQAGVTKLEGLASGVKTLQSGLLQYTDAVEQYTGAVNNVVNKTQGAMDDLFDVIVRLVRIVKPDFDAQADIGTIRMVVCELDNEMCVKMDGVIDKLATSLGVGRATIMTMKPAEVSVRLKAELDNGGAMLNAGVAQMMAGVEQLPQLVAGVDALVDGAKQLSDGLTTAESTVAQSIAETRTELAKLDGLDKFAAESVAVNEKPVNEVSAYGIAFAPFFISLSLWIGAFVLFVVLYGDREKRFKYCDETAGHRVRRTLIYMAAAVAQGVAMGLLLQWTLGLQITNEWLYLGSLVLASIMFEAIVEFLIVCLGDVGKFATLILLIVQVAASGGTFPIEVVSGGFQWMYNLLPMRYTISLFKECTVEINPETLLPAVILISIVAVVFVGINIVVGLVQNRKENV